MKRVGIDIGGTKISIGLVEKNKILAMKTIPYTFFNKPDELMEALTVKIRKLQALKNIEFIGIACPGRIENSVVHGAVNLGFDNLPIAELLGRKTGVKTLAENDATAALIGEIEAGSLVNCGNGLLLTLGTGVGGGICIDGKAYRGSTSSAGEFGHVVYQRGGHECKCGKRGCFEQYASTNALLREIREQILQNKDSVLYEYCNGEVENINGKLFFKAVKADDAFSLRILDTFTTIISEGICDFINILDVEVIAIGGGISEAGAVLIDPIASKVEERGFTTKIIKASLGGVAGVIGAAYLDKNL